VHSRIERTVTSQVSRGRLPNKAYRDREYLTEVEVERLRKAAGNNRYGHRDATAILICFRHGLRSSELVALRWHQIDFARGRLHISRLKNGEPSTHPLGGSEIRALRRLQREQEPGTDHVFVSERDAPMSAAGFRRMIERVGRVAKMPFQIHPHMLRHSVGFKLANDGRDTRSLQLFLGHRQIQHTVRYTQLALGRFNGWFKD
jgi:site-specific recombinase XerD